MLVLSARTGLTEAVLLDNSYLTAAAGAVAARWFARHDAKRVAIIGADEQARLQLKALRRVRDIEHVTVWAREQERALHYARDYEADGLPCEVADSVSHAIERADIARRHRAASR